MIFDPKTGILLTQFISEAPFKPSSDSGYPYQRQNNALLIGTCQSSDL